MSLVFIALLLPVVATTNVASITGGDRNETRAQRFVIEATSVIHDYLRNTARTIVLYTDGIPNTIQDLIISSLHSKTMQPVLALSVTTKCSRLISRQSAGFIMISERRDVDAFIQPLAHASELSVWRSWSPVIFVDTNLNETRAEITFPLLKTSWMKYETLNSLVICESVNRNESYRHVVVKRFNPFVTAGQTVTATSKQITTQKLSFNARGYPVKFPALDYPPFVYEVTRHNGLKTLGGTVGKVIDMIFLPGNFTPTTQPDTLKNQFQWVIPDSFFHEKFDFKYPLTVLQPDILSNTFYPYLIEHLVLIVPKAQQVPKWMTAVLPFTYTLWILYLSCYPILIVLGTIYSRFSVHESKNSFTVLEIFRMVFLGMVQHEHSFMWFRLFLASVMIFNIVLNNAYSGSFSSYITIPQYYEDINTLEDVFHRGLAVGLPSMLGSNYNLSLSSILSDIDSNDELTYMLSNELVSVTSVDDSLISAITNRNFSIFHSSTAARYEMNKPKYFQNGRPLLHMIPQSLFSLYCVSEYRKNNPFANLLDRNMWYALEGGFVTKHISDTTESVQTTFHTFDNVVIPLNMKHLQSFFYLLFCSYFISIMYFVIETSYL